MNANDNEVQQRIIRQMTPAQKLKASQGLYDCARALKAAGLRAQHPDWTEDMVLAAVRDAFLHAQT
jgi:hypothetical protein